MSGGEKSLVALAFMFAVFLARPCPFYILDEVEAALDDVNLDRFLELLRRHATHAQFIVITHQKRTMEAADWLYGVSMGANGVSKVISRRLPARSEDSQGGRALESAEAGTPVLERPRRGRRCSGLPRRRCRRPRGSRRGRRSRGSRGGDAGGRGGRGGDAGARGC